LIGTVASLFLHKSGDNPLRQAGKTALFSGAGFVIGNRIEKKSKGTL
jgi:hypothetical protein